MASLNKAQLLETPGGPGIVGAVKAGTNITIAPDGTISSSGVTQIVGGGGITVQNPTGPTVTITATGGIGSLTAGQNITITGTTNLTVAAPNVLPLAGGTMTGAITVIAGSASSPSIRFPLAGTGLFYDSLKQSISFSLNSQERFVFDDKGQALFGTPTYVQAADSPFLGACQTWTSQSDSSIGPAYLTVRATNEGGTVGSTGGVVTRRCRGTNPWVPQPVDPNDTLGQLFSYGANGSNWNTVTAGSISIKSGQAQNTNSQIVFSTDTDLTTSFNLTDWVRVGPAGALSPVPNNANDLGTSGQKWRALFVVNSPYVGNDANQVQASPLQAGLGLSFLSALTPVSFIRDVEYNEVYGEPTNPQDPMDSWVWENVETPVPGSTIHWGILAQDLQVAQIDLGLQGELGVYGGGENPGESMWVSQEELIAPMIQAIQELSAQLTQLQADYDAYVASHP